MEAPFRLIRYFSITALITIIMAAVSLSLFYRQQISSDVVAVVQAQNVSRTHILVDHVWNDIEPFIYSVAGLSGEAVRSHPGTVRIDDYVSRALREHSLGDAGSVKVRLFNPQGIIIYSTDNDEIGADQSASPGIIAALNGEVYSEFTHRQTFRFFGREGENVDVIETYVPNRLGWAETAIAAVSEIYFDVTPTVQRMHATQNRLTVGVILIMLVVYAILFVIVKRGDRIIRQALSAVKKSETRLAESQLRANSGSGVFDPVSGVMSWSEGIYKVLGIPIDTSPSTQQILDKIHPDDLERVTETMNRFMTVPGDYEFDHRIMRSDGEVRDIHAILTAEASAEEGTTSLMWTMQDITARKHAEQKLRQAQKARSLSSLAGGLTHELNNLLLPIITLTRMALKKLPEDHSERTKLKKVVEAGERAKVIIDEVLTFSRMTEPKKDNLEIASIVLDALTLIRAMSPATIKVELQVDENTGTVYADADRIKTVLMNLASNAVDAMEGKTGTLKISLSQAEVDAKLAASVIGLKAGAYAKMTVSDTGCGMDSESLERIFDPFVTTKDVGQGIGLGLSAVQGIVEQHGGAIDVSSETRTGTAFMVYLPLVAKPS